MKISVRLAIYSVILTAIAVILCCTLLLIATANNHIDSAIQNGVAELRMLNNSFNAEMDVVGDDQLSETAKRSVILYVFRKYTDASVSGAHYILTDMEQSLYNDCPIDPRPLLPDLKESHEQAMKSGVADDNSALWPYTIAELNGRKFLAVGHWSASLGDTVEFEHELFLARDITGVYDGITALAVRFAVIALITVLLSAAIMVFFIRRVLRPLGGLQKSAAALADGQYDNRIQIRGKDEISALAVSFNKMADAIAGHIRALQDTAEQRKLLLSALTHELKTPMTAIIGYSEALMRVHLKKSQQEESIAYINSECRRIERLSQKMMQFITLHGGEPANIKPQPVKDLYESVDMTLQGIARKENIELVFTEKGSPVFGMDIDMMASMLINLFDNARKAGAKHITITADDDAISVQDDGAGIPQEEIGKITQPFYMVDKSHSQSEGGSGLGLALCELIVKAHQARLHIESRVGVGTVITIRFEKLHFDDISKNT
jgi:signal transduction histidine kinase